MPTWNRSIFPATGGVTFRSAGDGVLRPAGWYWYGWDYGHFGDYITLAADIAERLKHTSPSRQFLHGKQWTVEEVEHDVIDVAINLLESLTLAHTKSQQLLTQLAEKKPS